MNAIVPPWVHRWVVHLHIFLPQWVLDRASLTTALLPLVFFLGHTIVYQLIRWQLPSEKATDRIVWAGISIGETCAWMYALWDLLPAGAIQPSLLVKLASGQGTELVALSTTLFMFVFSAWPYHLLSALTSRSAFSVSFVVRKTIPVAAILLTITEERPAPSTAIRLTAWLIRFLVVDAAVDAIAVRNMFVSKSEHPGTLSVLFKAAAIALWIAFFHLDPATTGVKFLPVFFWVAFATPFVNELNPFDY